MTRPETNVPAGPSRVLVIDDDSKLCRLIRGLPRTDGLRRVGGAHRPGGSGVSGEGTLEAVILDVMLPGWMASRC